MDLQPKKILANIGLDYNRQNVFSKDGHDSNSGTTCSSRTCHSPRKR